ncbi:Dolichyl-phosphate-mannose--protein mannosyltransferase 4 [Umbelopsis nana]
MTDTAVRKRHASALQSKQPVTLQEDDDLKKENIYTKSMKGIKLGDSRDKMAIIVITALALAMRLIYISFPAEVVFDEVHFGKFLGHYLRRAYFFDVHPPLAKLTLTAAGKLIGYDGHFDFANIGDNYIDNRVPHVFLRTVPATFGALCVPLVYLIMRSSGYNYFTCMFTTIMYLFDNALVGQSRLILLDSQLVFYMLCTVYSYIRFYRARHQEFSGEWYKWLFATGVSMALTLSVKMVGLFLVAAIGLAVLSDLWSLMDIKRGLEMRHVMKHFYARAVALIIVPAIVYLFWFWVHFSILDTSGPGDAFMSTAFQATLKGNPLTAKSVKIFYNDQITIQHRDTENFLFSWEKTYPLRYDDGRVSSQGPQVSANSDADDEGNVWQVLKTDASSEELTPVRHGDIIQLRHIKTDRLLMTHDVASPLLPTNTEYTTVPDDQLDRYNDTLFEVRFDSLELGTQWQSHMTPFQLIHVPTGVALFSQNKKWPEWAGYKYDVNGNKRLIDRGNRWIVHDVIGRKPGDDEAEEKKIEHLSFFLKFFELQGKMLSENNKLVAEHPYMSSPITWLIPSRGISYWHQPESRGQIYLAGNVVGWVLGLASIAIYAGIALADVVATKRGFDLMDEPIRRRFQYSGGFLAMLYALHYLPFYVMGRALFLHHYLPAVTILYMVMGAVFEFMFIEGTTTPTSNLIRNDSEKKNHKPTVAPAISTMSSTVTKTTYAAAAVIVLAQIAFFIWMIPLTYGAPGMSVNMVKLHQILGWELQFAK